MEMVALRKTSLVEDTELKQRLKIMDTLSVRKCPHYLTLTSYESARVCDGCASEDFRLQRTAFRQSGDNRVLAVTGCTKVGVAYSVSRWNMKGKDTKKEAKL